MTSIGTHQDPARGYYDLEDEPCGGQLEIVDQTGPVWVIVCDRCGHEAGLPARKADPQIHRRLRYEQAGFPRRFAGKHYDQDQHNRPAVRALHDWLRGYHNGPLPAPAIFGDAGRGKSHLLVVLCEKVVRECDATVMFRSSARLLDELQEAFDTGEHTAIWHRALKVDVLALDDLGAERPTEWRTDRLARLVDERWERELPIVVATNFPPRTWPDTFDVRTASRLKGMTFPVELRGADRRQLALQAAPPDQPNSLGNPPQPQEQHT